MSPTHKGMIPDLEEMSETVNSLGTRSVDRDVVVAAGSLLETTLEFAILWGMKKFDTSLRDRQTIFGRGGIDSFAQKISVAAGLQVISETSRSQLNAIRAVRNAFAHSYSDVDFDHPDIPGIDRSSLSDPSLTSEIERLCLDLNAAPIAQEIQIPGRISSATHMILRDNVGFVGAYIPDVKLLPKNATKRERFIASAQLQWFLLIARGLAVINSQNTLST